MITLLDSRYANTYLYSTDARDDNGFSHGMLVDCSCDFDVISSFLSKNKIILDYIVITHCHYDHLYFYKELKNLKTEVLAGENELVLFDDPEANVSELFGDPKTYDFPSKTLKDGEVIKLLDEEFHVICTPGHTPGSICLYNNEKNVLFTGDLLFVGGIGRTDFKHGDYGTILKSLKRISELPGDVTFYPGHGDSGMLSWEF